MSAVAFVATMDMDSEIPRDTPEVGGNGRPRWIALMASVLIIGLIVLFVTDRIFNPQNFLIDEIEVHGSFNHVDGEQVKQIIETAIEGNYFSVSLHRLENKIKQIPWVFSASLRRQWPSTIAIDVVEVQPVARWGDDKWLNFTGDLVNRQAESGLDEDANLPLLYGHDDEKGIIWKAFQQWSERFASSGLSLDEMKLDSTGLWVVKLSLGALTINSGQSNVMLGRNISEVPKVTMVVDQSNSFSRIQRFIKALNQELIVKFREMNTIDLRYPNGFSISWLDSEPVVQTLTNSGNGLVNKTETGFE